MSADISPAELTGISGVTAQNKVYDGTTTAMLKVDAAVFAGQVAGDKLVVSGASGLFGDKNAGLAKTVQISGLALGGADAANYRFTGVGTATTTADITRAPITVAGGITADNKVYDGMVSAQVNLIGGTLTRKEPQVMSSRLPGAAFSPTRTWGSARPSFCPSFVFPVRMPATTPWPIAAPTTRADITRATLSAVTAISAANKVYDGTTDATLDLSKAVLTGQVAGDNVQVTAAASSFDDKNAGVAKNVAISGITLAGSDLANYTLGDLGTARTQADITPRPLTNVAGITATSKVYDGSTDAPLVLGAATFDGKLAADQLSIVGATGAFADRHVGAGKKVAITGLTLSGLDARNYAFSQQTEAHSPTSRCAQCRPGPAR